MTDPRPFPVAVVLTVATGKLVCDSFNDMYVLAEHLTGDPVRTHEFASQELTDRLRDELIRQHAWLAHAVENVPDFTAVPRDQVEQACRVWTGAIAARVGDTVTVHPIRKDPLQ